MRNGNVSVDGLLLAGVVPLRPLARKLCGGKHVRFLPLWFASREPLSFLCCSGPAFHQTLSWENLLMEFMPDRITAGVFFKPLRKAHMIPFCRANAAKNNHSRCRSRQIVPQICCLIQSSRAVVLSQPLESENRGMCHRTSPLFA